MIIGRAGIRLVVFTELLFSAWGSCVWSACANKITSIGMLSCNTGYSYNGHTRDCGSPTCIFSLCTYTDEEHMCCPGDSCAWYDITCNWDTITSYFDAVSDHIKTAWSQLTEAVQDKLTTAQKFGTLTDAELISLDSELLSELKSVVGMTVHQFQVVTDKVHAMTQSHLQHFLNNLSPNTLSNGIASLAASVQPWATDQVNLIVGRLSSSDLWGNAGTWTSSRIDSLDKMISSMDLTTLSSFADEALANANTLQLLTSTQLGGLGGKLYGMSTHLLSTMFSKVNEAELANAMSSLTAADRLWSSDQVALFRTELLGNSAWGQIESWTSSNIGALGSMLSGFEVSDILNFADAALARATNLAKLSSEHVGRLGPKLFNMEFADFESMVSGLSVAALSMNMSSLTSIDFAWTSQQVSAFVRRLQENAAWGQAMAWTSDQIGSLGSMISTIDLGTLLSFDDWSLANATNLPKLLSSQLAQLGPKLFDMDVAQLTSMLEGVNAAALGESMFSLTGVDLSWMAEQTSAFVARLSTPEIWGRISDWTSETISALGSMIDSIDVGSILAMDGWSLANASNLMKLGAMQLGRLGGKMFSMSSSMLTSMLGGLNGTVLAESMSSITNRDWAWAADQASTFITTLQQSESWGEISRWTSAQLGDLGSILPSLPPEYIALTSDFSLATAASLLKFNMTQLSSIASKVYNMSKTHLTNVLDGLNASVLCEGLGNIARDYVWSSEQGSVFQSKLISPSTCGDALSWTAKQIGSLGSILTRLDVQVIENFTDSALAHATSLAQLSPKKITALAGKLGGMVPDSFQATLSGLDGKSIHASLLSQCEIQCEHDEDFAFLNDPRGSTAAAALEAYATRVREKARGAAIAYANAFCEGGATEYDAHARALYANLQAASLPCNGSAASNNLARRSFEEWSKSQAGMLIERLTEGDTFGSLATWSDEQITSACHQYSQFSPSQIAEMAAGMLISSSADAGEDVALVAAFGPLAPVADYAISRAAEQITPERREAWAAKFKQGLGNVADWGCSTVASLQTMAAGLQAADLREISLQAISGLKANAITAMSSNQLPGFTPAQMTSMLEGVRKRIHGQHLDGLSSDQIVAAVCGMLTFANTSFCPPVAIDLTMSFPSPFNKDDTIKYFTDQLPGVGASQIEVLMIVNQSDLPSNIQRRRLRADDTQVAIRIAVQQSGQKANITAAAKSAAASLATSGSGVHVLHDAVSYDIDPALTATTTSTRISTNNETNQGAGSPQGQVASTALARLKSTHGFQISVLALFFCFLQ